jgi:hypothetical protein
MTECWRDVAEINPAVRTLRRSLGVEAFRKHPLDLRAIGKNRAHLKLLLIWRAEGRLIAETSMHDFAVARAKVALPQFESQFVI